MAYTTERPLFCGNKKKLAALFGTASFITLSALPVYGQPVAPPQAPVEEVLVTGSLIHGAAAVGVPVTSLGDADFQEVGAVRINDVLKEVPGVNLASGPQRQTSGGANTSFGSPINIHNLTALGPRLLLMVDSMRYPPQNQDQSNVDPSIIPPLAIDNLQVLVDGSSATYGSDAVSGVVNVILKRRFDGAVTQAFIAGEKGISGPSWGVDQLYGRTWDSGDITVTFDTFAEAELKASERDFYTYDFTKYRLDDRTPINSATPGVISTGAPSATVGTGCVNCYSVPQGSGWDFGTQAPGPTTTWAALQANQGVKNLISPYTGSTLLPPQYFNAMVATFDQDLVTDLGPFRKISLFAEGFYENRRTSNVSTDNSVASGNFFTDPVPTTNPYYPTGAPAGIRVSYTLALDRHALINSTELGERYAGGFNLDLPGDWKGKLYLSVNQNHEVANDFNIVNGNAVLAALGNTIASVPAVGTTPTLAAYTKPATIPYLNVFCDSKVYTCNSDATLNYIRAYRVSNANWIEHQYGADFDGPIIALPAGELRAAIGGGYVKDDLYYFRQLNNSTFSPIVISPGISPDGRTFYSFYGQINAPIVSPEMMISGIRTLNIELSGRYDKYTPGGETRNPKVAIDYEVIDGVKFHTAWGTSFRAPAFVENSHFAHVVFRNQNIVAGNNSNNAPACTTIGGTPAPGSAAAILNPTCSAALQFQGGVNVGSTRGVAHDVGLVPEDVNLSPEKAQNASVGLSFAPTDMFGGLLKGLDVDVTYWFVRIRGPIGSGCTDLNNPACRPFIRVVGDPNFIAIRDATIAHPASILPPTVAPSSITFILDGTAYNLGYESRNGIDYNARYDWDMGDYGAFKIGTNGTYYIHAVSSDGLGNFSNSLVNTTSTSQTAPVGGTISNRWHGRYQLGWSLDNYSATLFANYKSHYFTGGNTPSAAVLAAAGITNFTHYIPEQYTFDLSLGYNTQTDPANEYLHNINLTLVVQNLLDRRPPFEYNLDTADGVTAYDSTNDPTGRKFTLTLTKSW